MATERDQRVGGEEYDSDRAKDAVEKERARASRKRRARGQTLAYVLIVLLAALGFWQQDKDAHARCEAGNEIRAVSRNNVLAIYDLGISLSQPPPGPVKGEPVKLSPKEQQDQKDFVDKLNAFRDKQLAKVPDDREC